MGREGAKREKLKETGKTGKRHGEVSTKRESFVYPSRSKVISP